MFKPVCDILSVEIERIAVALQPIMLHDCPLSTLPMGIQPTWLILPEKGGFQHSLY